MIFCVDGRVILDTEDVLSGDFDGDLCCFDDGV